MKPTARVDTAYDKDAVNFLRLPDPPSATKRSPVTELLAIPVGSSNLALNFDAESTLEQAVADPANVVKDPTAVIKATVQQPVLTAYKLPEPSETRP